MNYYDRSDELEDIVDTLDRLVDDIKDKYYKDVLNDIKYEAQMELDGVEEKIAEIEREEQRELEREFDKERL